MVSDQGVESRFRSEGDEVMDTKLNIIWRKSAEKQDDGLLMITWSEALAYAWQETQRDKNGYDWRLPTVEELSSLLNIDKEDRITYPDWLGERSFFWSSTPVAGASEHAWIVFFGFGYVFHSKRNNRSHVRLVREIPRSVS